MPNTLKYILVGLVILNLAFPILMFKVSYLEKREEIKSLKVELKKTQAGNESIKQLLVQPEDYLKYQKTISDRRAVLLDLMPLQVRLLDVQKWVASYARQSEVIIKSIKTAEEDIPFEIDEGSENLKYQTASIEVDVQGTFENLCTYMDFIEGDKRATISIRRAEFLAHKNLDEVIDANMMIFIIHPKA